MCWNAQISWSFALGHIFTYFYVGYRKPPEKVSFQLFAAFFTIMEMFQALQWTYGDIAESSIYGHTQCSVINTGFTIFAYILTWIQPFLFTVIGRLENDNEKFQILARLSFHTFIYAMISLIGGFWIKSEYRIPNSNYGQSTCTELGTHQHLGWKFSPLSIAYHTTYAMYLLLTITIFTIYSKPLQLTVGLGWLLTLLVSIFQVGLSVDLPAYCCLLSFF